MYAVVLRDIDLWARRIIPAVTTFMLILPGVVMIGAPVVSDVMPSFTMMAVFYWAVYRPDLLPSLVSFAIGLVQDVVTGTPFGMTALALLAVHGVATTQRPFFVGKSFFVAWVGFAVSAAAICLAMWGLTCFFASQIFFPSAALAQFLLTAFSFPLVVWILVRIHRYLLPRM